MLAGDGSVITGPHAPMKIAGLRVFLLTVFAWLAIATTILISTGCQNEKLVSSFELAMVGKLREVVRKTSDDSQRQVPESDDHKTIASRPTIKTDHAGANRSHGEAEITLDDIFISVKTTGKFHSTRLDLILRTWWTKVKDQAYIFTDVDDNQLFDATGAHTINTRCGNTHRRTDLCCKMAFEYDAFAESEKKWWCHFDDDNYVNVNVLLKVLRMYDWRSKIYLGKTSVNRGMEGYYLQKERVKFWFHTGGAGVCISKSLRESMDPWCRHGNLKNTCENLHLPDDCTLGFVINNRLRHDLTIRNEFNSHLESLSVIPSSQLLSQVTLSYSDFEKEATNVIRLTKEQAVFSLSEDPTRLLSYHCLIYPDTDWCPSKRSAVKSAP